MDAERFGSFIQQRRKELGMNQAQLAEKLHVTAKAVSRWERGVGFPSIELLQPLADALEITIAELMHSQRIEEDLSKESAAELVSATVNTIRQEQDLSRKEKRILFTGRAILAAVYFFLGMVAREYDFEPRWVGLVIMVIGIYVWHFGSRALYCLMTGEPFFQKSTPKRRTRQAKITQAVFVASWLLLLAVLLWFRDMQDHWRDLLVVVSIAAIVGSGILLNEMEKTDG